MRVHYKDIVYHRYSEIDLLGFGFEENNIHKPVDFIFKISHFLEVSIQEKQAYILLDLQHCPCQNTLHYFLYHQIIKQWLIYGKITVYLLLDSSSSGLLFYGQYANQRFRLITGRQSLFSDLLRSPIEAV